MSQLDLERSLRQQRRVPMSSIDRHVTREVVSLDASAPCCEAARLMAEKKIGAVCVKRNGRTVGLVTERDLVIKLLAVGASCDLPIAEATRSDIPSIDARASEIECSDLMRE